MLKGKCDSTLASTQACLFLDAVGFTPYAGSSAPNEVIGTLNDYFVPIVQCIHETAGDVDKFVGDQIFAVFDKPTAAITAALLIQARIAQISATRQARSLKSFEFRIGINQAFVVRGNVGGAERRDHIFIGDVVNVAARLQAVCESGGILVAESMLSWANGIARPQGHVRLNLRGRSEPAAAASLAGEKSIEPAPPLFTGAMGDRAQVES